jgi:hypothetical protein
MADTTTAPPDAAPAQDAPEARDWGRALDVAGVLAGVVLAVIVADILTDGRLVSRRLRKPKGDVDERPAD